MTPQHSRSESAERSALETAEMIRGAFRGFGVLVIGGLAQPLVGMLLEPLGYVWLPLVAVVAFCWSAKIAAAKAQSPVPTGAIAALGSYLLAVPLVLMATSSLDPIQALLTSVTAVVVGSLTGFVIQVRRAG